jgi:hypothetical protein
MISMIYGRSTPPVVKVGLARIPQIERIILCSSFAEWTAFRRMATAALQIAGQVGKPHIG